MNQITFEKASRHKVELGQVRSNGDGRRVLIVESEQVVDDVQFNAIELTGEYIFTTVYDQAVTAERIIEEHPVVIEVNEIKVIIKEELK